MPDSENSSDGSPRKKLILVADDEYHIAAMVAKALHGAGYAVAVVFDGQQAIDYLKAAPPPDFVVMDVMMPKKDGFEVLSLLKETERLRNVPYLMLAPRPADAEAFKGWILATGEYVHYIIKPFQPEELLAKVRHLIG